MGQMASVLPIPGGVGSVVDLRRDHRAGVFNRCDGLVVPSGKRVGPNDGHLFEHLHTVFEIAHAAAFVVAPGDGHLAHGVFQFAGDKEYFGIEAPALNRLQTKDHLGRGPAKGLEAALGVGKGQTHDGSGDPVEASAEDLPIHGLVDGLSRSVEPSGTDGDVGTVVEGLEEPLGLFHRR